VGCGQGGPPRALWAMPKRIRGATLQAIRERHFSAHPLCVVCESRGRTTLAEELDHIKPLFKGGSDTDDNRQGLCRACHLEKSITERGHKYQPKVSIGADGWPI
jgi:5-methylcytosine-specific restriction enzyme A